MIMTTFNASVNVRYHSGTMRIDIKVQAQNIIQARTMLEHLYGAENVFGVFPA